MNTNFKLQFSKMIPDPYEAHRRERNIFSSKKNNNGVDFHTKFCHVSL